MASSVSALSYLDPSVYQSLFLQSAKSTNVSEPNTGVSPTAEMQALQQQGNFQSLFNGSVAAALLQPATGMDSGTAMTTLVNNMLQQVLGAYQAQSNVPE
jgi:hypothetical protein